ncbi:MAG: glycine zipper 2TM domain-containing protein [Alphaproteobacteria bacterium]|nr:glycine zipper 2TM domain-containing protein [Alphaproteobacteria bacterium]
MRTLLLVAVTAVFAASTSCALADPPPWAHAHGWREHHHYERGEHYRPERYPPPPIGLRTRIYRGRDGRYYCRRSDGTTGLVVGAALGGLVGNRLAPGHSAILGTLLGAGAGALLGQAIDRGTLHCE